MLERREPGGGAGACALAVEAQAGQQSQRLSFKLQHSASSLSAYDNSLFKFPSHSPPNVNIVVSADRHYRLSSVCSIAVPLARYLRCIHKVFVCSSWHIETIMVVRDCRSCSARRLDSWISDSVGYNRHEPPSSKPVHIFIGLSADLCLIQVFSSIYQRLQHGQN